MLHSRWDDPAGRPGARLAVDSREPLRPRLRWRLVAHHRQHHPVPVTSKRSLRDYAAGFPNNSSSCTTRFWYFFAMGLSVCGSIGLWMWLVLGGGLDCVLDWDCGSGSGSRSGDGGGGWGGGGGGGGAWFDVGEMVLIAQWMPLGHWWPPFNCWPFVAVWRASIQRNYFRSRRFLHFFFTYLNEIWGHCGEL